MIELLDFNEDCNIGLFGFATDRYAICGYPLPKKIKVKVYQLHVFDSRLIGLFVTGHKSGIILPYLIEDDEKKCFENVADVLVLNTKYTCLGNLILMNDKGVVLSPLLKNQVKTIKQFFNLPCEVTTIAGLKTIGSCAVVTNKGCAIHPEASEEERKVVEETLGVECKDATVSFGSPFVGAGVIANSFAALVAKDSTGIEVGLISDALKV